ncbi:MAG: gas vesicle protein GvpG [Planctomycetes bacterium]|nr:gas vesicle protein GvpG [Planctomycetota bacterium]MBL7184832.1 gas vesicle protein GvpG [Phycisphaerae bacterium]
MFLLDSILLAPVKGVIWLGKKVNEVGENKLYGEGSIKEELMALQLQFELDEISEQEYDEKERELFDRLDISTKSKER